MCLTSRVSPLVRKCDHMGAVKHVNLMSLVTCSSSHMSFAQCGLSSWDVEWSVESEGWVPASAQQGEWGAGRRRRWEWEESQDAGVVRHRKHPQSKQDTKIFSFPTSRSALRLKLKKGKQLQHGMLVMSTEVCLSRTHIWTNQHAFQTGAKGWGGRLSVYEETNGDLEDEETRLSNRPSAVLPRIFLCYEEGRPRFSTFNKNTCGSEIT